MIEFWTKFWGVVLALSLGAFTVLAVSVAIGGFFDVKALLKSLDSQHAGENKEHGEQSG